MTTPQEPERGLPQPPPWAPAEAPGPVPGYGPAAYPPPPGYDPAAYPPPPGYGAPPVGAYPGYAPPRTSTKAIVALALAIGAYTPIVPFIGAIIALFVASSARRDIRASGGAETGLGLCTAATVLSWLHLILLSLAVLLVIGLFALPFSFS